jgi:hypothetical protein
MQAELDDGSNHGSSDGDYSDASSLSSEIGDLADILPAADSTPAAMGLRDETNGGGVWFDALLSRLENAHACKLEHA